MNRVNAGAFHPSPNVVRLGLWSAIATAMIALSHCVIGVLTPPRSGPFAGPADLIPYPYTSVSSFIPGDYIWLFPGFLLALVFVVLMACIHYYVPEDRRVFSQIGLSFALIYATVITVDYFLQFTVVQPSLLSGETAGLSLLTQYSPHGIFIALEGLGYFTMSVALLFAGAAITGGKLERAIRWLFIASFVLAAGSLVTLSWLGYDIVAYEVTVLSIDWIALIVSGALLGVLFRRAGRSQSYGPAESPADRGRDLDTGGA